jgi:hypothetical protein
MLSSFLLRPLGTILQLFAILLSPVIFASSNGNGAATIGFVGLCVTVGSLMKFVGDHTVRVRR